MSSPFRIGYNVNCEHSSLSTNRQAAADNQIALHSTFTLLLDDYKSEWFFTKQIQSLSPETQIIHRRYWYKDPNNPSAGGWDGSLWRAPNISADNILNTLEGAQKAYGIKGVIEQLGNEPSVHVTAQDPQGNELRTMLKLDVDCLKKASGRGMRLAIDIGQSVTWVQKEIDDGFYDELLFTFATYPQHFLSIHEYGLGDLWLNTDNGLMEALTYNRRISPDAFIVPDDMQLQSDYTEHPSEAHLGRVEIMAQRCRKIGVPIPKMIYTEVGWDRTRIAQQNDVDAINGRAAMGFPTLTQYWKTRYPQWTQAQTAFEMCKWLNRAMPDYIVGACLFGKDTSFENGAYHIESVEFQRLLADYSREVHETNTTPTPPTWAQTVQRALDDHEARLRRLEGK